MLWRVDWLSNVVINQLAKSEPGISVFLSEIKGAEVITSESFGSKNSTSQYIEVQIGVGHLSLVYIGSIWKNGYICESSNKLGIFDLDIDTTEAKPIIFWESTKVGGYRIISNSEYPTGWKAFSKIKESPLIAIPYNGDPNGLLVPAIEIIRFYYLISSPMATAIFYGVFESLTKSIPSFDDITRIVYLKLNAGVDQNSAWVIARYWSSELVKQRINDIHKWVQKNAINGVEKISQSTFLPFDGKSAFKFQGKKIRGDDGIERYLCTRLIYCSRPFLFDDVIVVKEARLKSLIKASEEPARDPAYWPIYKQESTNVITSTEEPSKKFIAKIIVNPETRFGGILNKVLKVETIDLDSERFPKILFNSGEKDKKISTANGTYANSNTRPAKISVDLNLDDINAKASERLTTFFEMLEHLRREYGMIVKTLPLVLPQTFQYKPGYKPVETFEYKGETIIGCFKVGSAKNSWVELKVGSKIKPRGLILVEVKHNSKIWYLMELEQHEEKLKDCYSILMLRNVYNSVVHNDVLYKFIRECGRKKGWPQLTKEDATFLKIKTISHHKNYGEKILNQLLNNTQ